MKEDGVDVGAGGDPSPIEARLGCNLRAISGGVAGDEEEGDSLVLRLKEAVGSTQGTEEGVGAREETDCPREPAHSLVLGEREPA